MAEKNVNAKKDFGSPLGIILGIIVFIIGVALQDKIFTISGFITNPVSYTHLTLPTNREV